MWHEVGGRFTRCTCMAAYGRLNESQWDFMDVRTHCFYCTKIGTLYDKIPPIFNVHSFKYDPIQDMYICTGTTCLARLKIGICISILAAICMNGLYLLTYTQQSVLETNLCCLFLICFSLIFVSYFPLLLHPDIFTSLLNGVRKFRKEERALGR